MMYYTSSKFFDTSPVRLSLTQTMLEDFESPSTVNGQFWTPFYAVKVTDFIYLVSRVSGRVHLDPGGLYKAPIYFQTEIKIPKDIPIRAGICETNGRNIPNVKRPNVGPPMT